MVKLGNLFLSFVRGGPSLTMFFFFSYNVVVRKEDRNTTISG